MKVLLDKKLLKIEQRDTILAEKLKNAVVISEINDNSHSGVIREDQFADNPFLDSERVYEGNHNPIKGKPFEKKFKKQQEQERQI